ncbi:ABC transporter permease [Mucilaginibacter psychrotolerans]|uniref:FtsX-like permease family protein n=1 Tax=Mucilaginibacter psychrotolerans TaxID=1524096 RepID=A0A4Y8SKU0_9SPHI|nr:ABC transporter permease [Mucilaginibacter psychrotolerans]TFF39679.1 FtsX-like permease family protein [Mucilaginibacter psychrotolerans]
MYKIYFKTAWRNLRSHKATSIINISGLAVGMAAAVLIFIWVQNEFNFDTNQPEEANIYRIKSYLAVDKTSTWIWENSPYILGDAMKRELPEVEDVARISPNTYRAVYLNVNGEFFPEKAMAYVDNHWFDVFKYDFISGGSKAFVRNPFSIILSESKAKKYFNKQDAVGKTIRIDSVDYQVQGVVKDNPANSSFAFDVLIPVAAKQSNKSEKDNDLDWGNFNYMTFVKLHPGAKLAPLSQKIKEILHKNRKEDNLKIGLTPLAALHFEDDLQNSQLAHGDKKVVYVFVALGILLLVIACINYVNLTTARASLRAKEVSVKKIVGAGRLQLFMQFIAESGLVSSLSLILTIVIIWLALPAFNQFTGRNFVLSFGSGYIGLILLGTLLVAVILNSIYPALLLSSFKPMSIFRGTSVLHLKDTSLRKGLVVVQFTFSIFLIIGVITIYRQLKFINSQNPGYKREQVLTISLPISTFYKYKGDAREALCGSVKQALLSQSGVNAVSLMGTHSIQDNQNLSSGGTDWDGRAKDFDPSIAFFNIDPDYAKIVKVNLLEGRWFMPGNLADKRNAILNETAARELNLHKPYVGQRFVSRGDTGQVIGVVKDFNFKSMHEKIAPAIFKNHQDYVNTFLIGIAPGKQADAIKKIQAVWGQYFNNEPLEYTFLDQEFDRLYKNDTKSSGLMSVFAIVAILISSLGLFGLAAFTAEQRGKEIGIRKVLGATVSGLVALLSKDFILLVIGALVIAAPLAGWLMSKWLNDFAYRIDMTWWIYATAGIIAVSIAFVTISFQAIKAAMANPVKSLRSE